MVKKPLNYLLFPGDNMTLKRVYAGSKNATKMFET